jgi:hypothetical protein
MVDLSGKKFGRLTVVARVGPPLRWVCVCNCGSVTVVRPSSLTSGSTRSCGCLREELTRRGFTYKHGHTSKKGDSPEYQSWHSMKGRCRNPNDSAWQWYGARGITICARWNSFSNFLADMGPRPKGKTLDRIDSSKNYEPVNCRWATAKEQAANRRPARNAKFTAMKVRTVRALASLGVSKYELARRFHVGESSIRRILQRHTWKHV